jgi:hypothetical protein
MLHQPLEVSLELVMVGAFRTCFEVELHLEYFRRVQLAVDKPIELIRTFLALHVCTCWLPLPRTIPDSNA